MLAALFLFFFKRRIMFILSYQLIRIIYVYTEQKLGWHTSSIYKHANLDLSVTFFYASISLV